MDEAEAAPVERRRSAAGKPQRELPHNLDLERAVLAVVLDGRHAVAMQQLREAAPHPLLFWNRDHRLVHLACLAVDDSGERVDAPQVAEYLSRLRFDAALDQLRRFQLLFEADEIDGAGKGRLREVYAWRDTDRAADEGDSALAAIGGAGTVYALVDAPGSAAALKRNAQLLRDYYLKRRLIARLGRICDHAYLTTDEFPALISLAQQAALELQKADRTTTVHEMGSAVDETFKAIVDRMNEPDAGLKTGMEDIDERLMALRGGGLYILAARPGVGKTSLALRIVQGIVSNPTHPARVLFFSLEVDRRDLLKKVIAAVGKIDFKGLDQGSLPPEDFGRLEETIRQIRDWPMEMMDVADLTVHQLRAVAKRRMLETNGELKLVVLDYLQLLQASRPDQDEYAKIVEISRVLKVMAMELGIPVLALSQMSRDSEKGTAPREPRLSDLRGAGSIEQDADAVLFIHRVDQGDDSGGPDSARTIKVIIAKNRFGPTGFTLMHFFPAKMSFEPAAMEEDDDEDDGHASRGERLKAAPTGGEDLFNTDAPVP